MALRFFLLFTFLFTTSNLYSKESCTNSAIKNFFEEEDKFRLLTELKKVELENRDSSKGLECANLIFNMYINNEEYASADTYLDLTYKRYNKKFTYDIYIKNKSQLYFLMRNYNYVSDNSSDEALVFSANILKKDNISTQRCNKKFCSDIDLLLSDSTLSSRKDERLALVLGIFPGGGQFYAGRTYGALSSFIINTFLFSLTNYAFNKDERALGYTLGAVSVAIYSGSIYSGYEAARRYNEEKRNEKEEIIRKYNKNRFDYNF
jgi:hypothetical protein